MSHVARNALVVAALILLAILGPHAFLLLAAALITAAAVCLLARIARLVARTGAGIVPHGRYAPSW